MASTVAATAWLLATRGTHGFVLVPTRRRGGVVSSLASAFDEAWRERRPLVARGVFDTADVVDPDQVAGLAMEPDVCARVMNGSEKYTAPVSEEVLTSLEAPWSVLVNDAEKLLPRLGSFAVEVFESEFLRHRSWLRDDVMVSVSSTEGGIGPHCDSSDVILLQCAGSRRWSIETTALSPSEEAKRLVDGERRLETFEPDASFVLHPGDFLFVPARIPHDGIALEDLSVTASFGFRTMHDAGQLLEEFILDDKFDDDTLVEEEKQQQEDAEPLLLSTIASVRSGCVPADAVDVLRNSLRQAFEDRLQDDTKLYALLGRAATAPRDITLSQQLSEDDDDASDWDRALADDLGGDLLEEITVDDLFFSSEEEVLLHHAAGARFAVMEQSEIPLLAVNGRTLRVPSSAMDLARAIADNRSLRPSFLRPLVTSPACYAILQRLLDRGDLIAVR